MRIQTYLGLLYQDLVRAGTLSVAGRLPPVLPVVLYNGVTPWRAAETLEPLIEPAPPVLERYRPRQAYLLLDEQRLAKDGSLPERNLCAALFRLEASRGAVADPGVTRSRGQASRRTFGNSRSAWRRSGVSRSAQVRSRG